MHFFYPQHYSLNFRSIHHLQFNKSGSVCNNWMDYLSLLPVNAPFFQKMRKARILIVVLFLAWTSRAQVPFLISLQNSLIASSDSVLPFWFSSNQNGMVEPSNQLMNLSTLFAGTRNSLPLKGKWDYQWGSQFAGGIGSRSYFQINQLFAGLGYRGWELKAGLFHEPLQFNGLSTTNGNLAQSNNARPFPTIRLSTKGFIPAPFKINWLTFKLVYDEGLLNDKRYVDQAHLHHKAFHTGFHFSDQWNFRIGAEHYVMWGGVSRDPTVGAMPEDPTSYMKYILGLPGDEKFPIFDRYNVAGNQYGTYQLELNGQWNTTHITLFLSHPFEDFSGVNWFNWPDNLVGLYLQFDQKEQGLTHILYEYTNTRQQSVRGNLYNENGEMIHFDNYFYHGIYLSGATYHQRAICSPLFAPVIVQDGISYGMRSNRLFAHHLGVIGKLNQQLTLKLLMTYIKYYGNYWYPIDPPTVQFSSLVDLSYQCKRNPIQLGISAGFDLGNEANRRAGLQLRLVRVW